MSKRRHQKQPNNQPKTIPQAEVSSPQFWEERYAKNEISWDLGGPTPIFERWLGKNYGSGKKACVLGAGNGYDALAFAACGYDVTAVDFAPTPLNNLIAFAKKRKLNIKTVASDMFNLQPSMVDKFDLVLEYTVYCAIDPQRRDEYVSLVSRLLKPGGILLGIFFPIGQDSTVGPPYGVNEEDLARRFNHDFVQNYAEWPEDSVASRRLRERFITFEKR